MKDERTEKTVTCEGLKVVDLVEDQQIGGPMTKELLQLNE